MQQEVLKAWDDGESTHGRMTTVHFSKAGMQQLVRRALEQYSFLPNFLRAIIQIFFD